MTKPTPEELRELFSYDPETGELRWKISLSRRTKIGDLAGSVDLQEKGRINVRIRGTDIRAHRIIWTMVTGRWPTNQIDHINENPNDNRWCNLREATKSQNMMNITRVRSNSSGYKGVSWHKVCKKWRALIAVNNQSVHLGLFETRDDARDAYIEAAKKLHGEFAKY